jgi:Skp family chaperone for outer membrane proteins
MAMLPLLLLVQATPFALLQATPIAPPSDAIAVVNMRRVLADSAVARAATAKVNALRAEREKALADRQAAIDTSLKQGAPALDIQRMRLDLQRMAEDAETDITDLARSVQEDFAKRLRPVLQQILEEDRLGLIFEVPNPVVVWAHPSVDVTSKVIQRLDAPPEPKK